MTGCCRSGPCEQIFGPRLARRSLERYRSKGLDPTERALVDAALESGIEGAAVLEIGGGIGALQSELLEAGAGRGEVVEIVRAYEPYARELAQERGLEERTRFRVVDVLEEPAAVEPADVVLLNRVVCCSEDGVELTETAARLARRSLLLSYPRDTWWIRAGARALNAGQWLFRRSFRVFIHRPADLVAAGTRAGLARERTGGDRVWEYAILRRAAQA
jgi:Methyltransferase domain